MLKSVNEEIAVKIVPPAKIRQSEGLTGFELF